MKRFASFYIVYIVGVVLLFLSSTSFASFDENFSLRLGYRSKEGLGYKKNYGTLGVFFAPVTCCNISTLVPLIDLRAHLLENGRWAGNAGVGVRGFLSNQLVYGINLFYDYRNTSFHSYNQVGFGAELLNCFVDVRVNGYVPLGKKNNPGGEKTFLYTGGFFARRRLHERAYRYAQLEFGKGCQFSCFSPYLAVGPYFVRSHRKQAAGVMWRLTATCCNSLTLEVAGTRDHIFKNRCQFFVGIDFSLLGAISKNLGNGFGCCCKNLCDRLRERIYRNEIIVLKRKCVWKTNYISVE